MITLDNLALMKILRSTTPGYLREISGSSKLYGTIYPAKYSAARNDTLLYLIAITLDQEAMGIS